MADEKEKAEEKPKAEPPKKGSMKLVIILVVALAVLGGGGTVLWFKVIAPAIGAGGDSAEKKEEATEESKTPEILSGPMFPLDPFIINLSGEGGKRFLKLTIELELNDENLNLEITASLPKIKDSILILLSSKTFEDVYTVEGKFKLRDEITARVNRFLATGHIRNVYFTEFVIQ